MLKVMTACAEGSAGTDGHRAAMLWRFRTRRRARGAGRGRGDVANQK